MKRSTPLCYALAEQIEKSPSFRMEAMRTFGQPACIAAQLAFMVKRQDLLVDYPPVEDCYALIVEHLECSRRDAEILFHGQFSENRLTKISASEAAAALRKVARGEQLTALAVRV